MPVFGSCAFKGAHGCIFVGGGSSCIFVYKHFPGKLPASQLVPSIRKAAHREIRQGSKADCWNLGRELAAIISRFLSYSISFPFPILNNCLIVKRDDSHSEISSVLCREVKRKELPLLPLPSRAPKPFSVPAAPTERQEEGGENTALAGPFLCCWAQPDGLSHSDPLRETTS